MEEVVVAARCQLGAAGGPFQAAYLLLMALHHSSDVLTDPAQRIAAE